MSLRTDLEKILLADPWAVRDKLAQFVAGLDEEEYREYKPRTEQQNRALHLFFHQLAEHLNNSNLTVQTVVKEAIEIDWTDKLVKELLWRRAQQAILGKDSTTELAKLEDIDRVYDHLVRHLGEKFGLEIPAWPNDPDPAPLLKDNQ